MNDHEVNDDSLNGKLGKLEKENNWMDNVGTSSVSGFGNSSDNNAFSLNYCIDDDT